MPIYEYQCETCNHQFEVKQKFSDPPVETCVKCGKGVRKLISAPGIMFKGTGWYVTDYSNKLKDPSLAKPSGESAEKSEKKDGGSSETKSGNGGGESSSSSTKSEPSSSGSSSSSSASSSSSSD